MSKIIILIISLIFQFNIIFTENFISTSNGENINKYSSSYYKSKNINPIKISESHIPIRKIILFLIISLGLFIIYTAIRNTMIMNKFIKENFSLINNNLKLEEIDIGDLKKIRIKKILVFNSEVYYIEGLGFLSLMTVNIGIMQMITFGIIPFEKDLPYIIGEFIYLLGKRKFLIEIYDFLLDKKNNKNINFINKIKEINEKMSDLEPLKTKKNWYDPIVFTTIKKGGSVKDDNKLINSFKEILEAYIEFAKEESLLNEEDKEKKYLKIKGVAEEFIEKGGIAVDTFKNSVGIAKTSEVLGKIIFCHLLFKELKINKKKKAKNE